MEVHHCLASLFLLIGKSNQSKNVLCVRCCEILLTGGITVGMADTQCVPRVVFYHFTGHWRPAFDFIASVDVE